MTRSVEELRRQTEQSRAELAATVEQLRARIADTAEDIRHKASPQHIKSEVADYASQKARLGDKPRYRSPFRREQTGSQSTLGRKSPFQAG